LIVLATVPTAAQSQDGERVMVRIETRDGNTVLGELISETDTELVVRTTSTGDVTI
jgi:hypothetical protein